MPVLLLARGDAQSRDLVRRAFTARYGIGAPSIDTLRIDYKGRMRAKVGPVAAWVPLEFTMQFRFPNMSRWDYSIRTVGVNLSSNANAFDGTVFRHRKGHDVIQHADETTVNAIKAQIWATMVMLLTPLSDPDVQLRAVGTHLFTATHEGLNSTASLCLNADDTLNSVEANCLNVFSGHTQMLRYDFTDGQHLVNDLILPGTLTQLWDGEPTLEMQPIHVQVNPPMSDALFRLEH